VANSKLTPEIKAEIRRYLRTPVLAAIAFLGVGTVGTVLGAGWRGATAGAKAIAERPALVAAELGRDPSFLAKMNETLAAVPTGTVIAFAGEKIPAGWELCDGRLVDKNDPRFRVLFDVIGTVHGGNASPNFQLPDYRGMFLRGVDPQGVRDLKAKERQAPGQDNTGNAGARLGSIQEDEFKSHKHMIPGLHLEAADGKGFDGAGLESNSLHRDHAMAHDYGSSTVGGVETRPKNACVNYIIKL
jgi:microcystin-dependent protein